MGRVKLKMINNLTPSSCNISKIDFSKGAYDNYIFQFSVMTYNLRCSIQALLIF